MFGGKSNGAVAAQLLLTVTLWGGNNVAVKYQIQFWPPVFTAATRFLCAGFLLVLLMRWTRWFGRPAVLDAAQRRSLWVHGGLSLAAYIVVFVLALAHTSASTVALFMGTSPVWALLWEERFSRHSAHRYAAALLALTGAAVLFLPGLTVGSGAWLGNLLALGASILWTVFSRQCRRFAPLMTGLELTGQTFWRAGVILIPVAAVEVGLQGAAWNGLVAVLHVYSILFSGLLAFAMWHGALRVWPMSRAFLFGNLIPVTTMAFSHVFLGEQITVSFWVALALIIGAVLLGQADWRKIISSRWWPAD